MKFSAPCFKSSWIQTLLCSCVFDADSGFGHGAEDPLFREGDPEPSRAQPVEGVPAHKARNCGLNKRLRQVRDLTASPVHALAARTHTRG